MPLALSTSWNSFRHLNGADIIGEIKALGFRQVELNFSLTAPMLKNIAACVKKGGIKVSSVHNYCPIPPELTVEEALPDCYSMSSQDDDERHAAVKYTKKSIDTAGELNAKAVVLHCGRVEIPDKTRDLIACYNEGLVNTEKFNKLKSQIVREREAAFKPFLDNTLKSLDELSRYARKKNICLGVENRYYYREIPTLGEIGIILAAFKGSNVFYWHDSGHAQLMENLGFWQHKDHLSLYADFMLGVHLHDITGTQDHQAPSCGQLDFKMLAGFIKKQTIKVMEAHHPASPQDILKGKRFLEQIFDGKP
ncbi:MAG: sugar phosphate isomerase/epimerase [Candidatus Omnitrophota bacterium]